MPPPQVYKSPDRIHISFTECESEYTLRYKITIHKNSRTSDKHTLRTISSDCGCMIGPTRHLYDYLPCQRLSNSGNVLPAIVLKEKKGTYESWLFRSIDSALDAIRHIAATLSAALTPCPKRPSSPRPQVKTSPSCREKERQERIVRKRRS
jgi:hypothetical protein